MMTTQMQSHGTTPARAKFMKDINKVCDTQDLHTLEKLALLGNMLGQIIGATAGNEKSIMVGIDTVIQNLQQGILDQVLCVKQDHGNA
jgi:hypothetical protein